MKNALLLLFVFFLGINTQAQRVQSSNYSTMYYISSDGKIQDSSYKTVGYIKDGRIQDSSYKTIGYVRDGRIQDASYRTVGYIDKDGRVQDGSYRTLGYASGISREWIAVVFFFFQM